MPLQLEEYVINAALAKLDAGVNARIDTINAEFADDVILSYPTNYRYGVAPMPPGTLTITTDGGSAQQSSFAEEGAHSLVHDLQLIVLVKDDEATVLSTRAALLGKAFKKLAPLLETLSEGPPPMDCPPPSIYDVDLGTVTAKIDEVPWIATDSLITPMASLPVKFTNQPP